jgi:hypothetical protein
MIIVKVPGMTVIGSRLVKSYDRITGDSKKSIEPEIMTTSQP